MQLPAIRQSQRNPHLLETQDGAPFFMLGDTAWELFHRLTLEEADHYFGVRASQGFNMIWANLLPEFDGLTTPNRYGELPLIDLQPSSPNERYFELIDQFLELAVKHGLYVGLLPAWGDKLTAPWGVGPRIFRFDNLPDAKSYAKWLGNRYSGSTNVMWVLGGDRPAKLFGDDDQFPMTSALEANLPKTTNWTPIWRAMAEGLKEAGANQLITYHPQGGKFSTSVFLHEEAWLDLNAMQSGHGGGHDVPVWEWIERDYNLQPIKPTFDAEPNYEDHPVNPWPVWDPASGFFDDFDVRKQIYRSIFAGGCGVIYGHHCVWQFATDLYEPISEVRFNWKDALLRPGAQSLAHLNALLSRFDLRDFTPNQSRIIGEVGGGASHARAISSKSTGSSKSETLVYVPDGRPIEIDLSWADPTAVEVEEFNPVTGESVPVTADLSSTVLVPKISAQKDRLVILRTP